MAVSDSEAENEEPHFSISGMRRSADTIKAYAKFPIAQPRPREAVVPVKRMQEDLEYFHRYAMPDPHRTRDAAPDDEEHGQPAEAAE